MADQRTTLARTAQSGHGRELWNDPNWQRIWLAIQGKEWRSLAVLPASYGMSTFEVAQALVEIGWQHRGLPIGLADLRNVTLPYIDSVIDEVRSHVFSGERVLIALPSVFENPATVPIAQAADSAVLCIALGSTKIASAEESIQQVGHARFLGTIIVRDQAHRGDAAGRSRAGVSGADQSDGGDAGEGDEE
jgi:hypothetical protein